LWDWLSRAEIPPAGRPGGSSLWAAAAGMPKEIHPSRRGMCDIGSCSSRSCGVPVSGRRRAHGGMTGAFAEYLPGRRWLAPSPVGPARDTPLLPSRVSLDDEETPGDSGLLSAPHRCCPDVDRSGRRPARLGAGREAGVGDLRPYPFGAVPVHIYWRRSVVNQPGRGNAGPAACQAEEAPGGCRARCPSTL
jgi:hypothetical protein